MIIYHGSKQLIKKPIVNGSNPFNDYGPSFYVSPDLDAAKMWACKNSQLGIVNKYFVKNESFKRLKILDLTDKNKWSVLNWLAVLMHFRELSGKHLKQYSVYLEWISKYYVDVTKYDVVIGFRADDAYFRFPLKFFSGELSFDDLERIYLSGKLGVQYAFMSKRAINEIHFEKAIECDEEYLGAYYSLVVKATKEFDELINAPFDAEKTYIIDLIRKENEK